MFVFQLVRVRFEPTNKNTIQANAVSKSMRSHEVHGKHRTDNT